MINPRFSVIVPVYNAEKFIKKCILSLLTQTYSNLEIIVVDDGSSDSSLSTLKSIEGIDNRLKLISQVNSGPSTARNVGIENSKGEYITFVDADDWLESNAYEILDVLLRDNNYPDIVMFNGFINDTLKNRSFLKTRLYNKNEIKKNIFPRLIESEEVSNGGAIRSSVCLRAFRRELVHDRIRFEKNLRNNEDLVFCVQATLYADSFLYLGDTYLYHNCITRVSLSRSYMPDSFERMKPLFNVLTEINNNYSEYDFTAQIKTRVFRTLIYCFENEFRIGNSKSLYEKYLYLKLIMYKNEFSIYLSDFTPINEKSKRIYYFLFKNKCVLMTMLFAKYNVTNQNKRLLYV